MGKKRKKKDEIEECKTPTLNILREKERKKEKAEEKEGERTRAGK